MSRKSGVFFSYLLILAEALFSIFMTPYMIRSLGNAEYGVYQLILTLSVYLLLLDLGMGQAIIRWIAKYRASEDEIGVAKFLGISTLFYMGISIVAFFGGRWLIYLVPRIFSVGLLPSEIELVKKLMNVTVINISFTLLTTPFANTIVAYERFAFSKSISILQILLRTVLFVVALNHKMGSYGLVFFQLVVTIIGRLAYIYYVMFCLKLKPIFRDFDKTVAKETVIYSAMMFIITIVTQLNNSLDNILLAAFAPDASAMVAIYSIALQIACYYNSIGDGMTGVLMPGVVRLVESGVHSERLIGEMVRIGRLILSVGIYIVIGFIVCGKRFIYLWVGKEFEIAYYVAVPLLFLYMIIQFQDVGMNIINAKNELREYTVMRVITIVINVIISIVLIKWNPIIGVMVGTIISLIIGSIIAKNLLFIKYINLNIKEYYLKVLKGIFPCALITVCVCLCFNDIFDYSILGFLLMAGIVSAIYIILMWFFGYNMYEKEYIKNILFN